MYGHVFEQIGEATFVEECLHEAAIGQGGQDARRDAAAQVDTTSRQHFQRQVACLCAKDRHKQLQCGVADRAVVGAGQRILHNHRRHVLGGGDFGGQPIRFRVAPRLFVKGVQVGDADPRADALVAHMVEACEQEAQ